MSAQDLQTQRLVDNSTSDLHLPEYVHCLQLALLSSLQLVHLLVVLHAVQPAQSMNQLQLVTGQQKAIVSNDA